MARISGFTLPALAWVIYYKHSSFPTSFRMPDSGTKKATKLAPEQPRSLIGGHLRSFFKDRTGFLTRQAELGDVSRIQMGGQPAFFINHPDLIRDVLVTSAAKFEKGRALQRTRTL